METKQDEQGERKKAHNSGQLSLNGYFGVYGGRSIYRKLNEADYIILINFEKLYNFTLI